MKHSALLKLTLFTLLLFLLCSSTLAEQSFSSAPDMANYLFQCIEQRMNDISFTLTGAFAQTTDAELEEIFDDVADTVNWRAYSFSRAKNKVQVQIRLWYRPGVRMVDAWRSGDTSGLTADEITCLNKAKEIVAQLRVKAHTTLKIEKAIHDYLCETITYTYGTGISSTEGVTTATWALLRGTANCQGYADAFYLLGNLAGLEVDFMSGLDGEEEHVWNTIRLDGNLYIVDVTHDDPDDNWAEPKYIYFNIGLDLLPENRQWYTCAQPEPISAFTSGDLYFFNGKPGFGRMFFTLDEAAKHCYEEGLKGDTYMHVAVYGAEPTTDEINKAVSKAVGKHPRATEWTYLYYYRGGHTFLTFHWKKF